MDKSKLKNTASLKKGMRVYQVFNPKYIKWNQACALDIFIKNNLTFNKTHRCLVY